MYTPSTIEIVVFVIIALGICVTVVALLKVKEGYEDEDGFHLGHP